MYACYEGCLESIQPFSISPESVAWPWCNLAASQTRPYCACVNTHSPVGLVSRQWEVVDWACLLCDRRIHSDRASKSTSSPQCACQFYSSGTGFFWGGGELGSITSPRSVSPRTSQIWLLRLLVFSKAKITVERKEICKCDGNTVQKLSQRRLTADWLAPRESDCSRMRSKVFSGWLPCYVKANRQVLEILKMAGYSTDSPRIRPPDDGHRSDRNMLLKNNNIWQNIFINVYWLYYDISTQRSLMRWKARHKLPLRLSFLTQALFNRRFTQPSLNAETTDDRLLTCA